MTATSTATAGSYCGNLAVGDTRLTLEVVALYNTLARRWLAGFEPAPAQQRESRIQT